MLVVRGDRRIGAAKLRWDIAISGILWHLVVQRRGLTFDTRWVPASPFESKGNACVYLLLEGSIQLYGSASARHVAPAALVLSEAQLEGSLGQRSLTYRASGDPFVAIQMNFPAAFVPVKAQDEPPVLRPPPDVWRLAARATEGSAFEADLVALLGALSAAGIVDAQATAPKNREVPPPFQRAWGGLKPFIEKMVLTPTLQELTAAMGVSVRQTDRVLRQLVTHLGHLGSGWRSATHHMRLKLAVLLLSAPDASIADVATAVGYGSSDAMARAFRVADLPAPALVQAALQDA